MRNQLKLPVLSLAVPFDSHVDFYLQKYAKKNMLQKNVDFCHGNQKYAMEICHVDFLSSSW